MSFALDTRSVCVAGLCIERRRLAGSRNAVSRGRPEATSQASEERVNATRHVHMTIRSDNEQSYYYRESSSKEKDKATGLGRMDETLSS